MILENLALGVALLGLLICIPALVRANGSRPIIVCLTCALVFIFMASIEDRFYPDKYEWVGSIRRTVLVVLVIWAVVLASFRHNKT